jgi:hypothetical protein
MMHLNRSHVDDGSLLEATRRSHDFRPRLSVRHRGVLGGMARQQEDHISVVPQARLARPSDPASKVAAVTSVFDYALPALMVMCIAIILVTL